MRVLAICLIAIAATTAAADAQTRRRTPQSTRRPAPARVVPPTKAPAQVTCPAELGAGLNTKRTFCDVLSGRDPKEGVVVTVPPHTGPARLTFDLHNRHTYSEEQTKAGRAFADYIAVVAVVARPAGDVLARAAVQSTFRQPTDLFDRVGGGAGPGGVKAVAPLGAEPIVVEIPAEVPEVALLGERLTVDGADGRSVFTSAGRPVAVVSNVMLEYKPAPPKPVRRRR